jgi:hypothetical protein
VGKPGEVYKVVGYKENRRGRALLLELRRSSTSEKDWIDVLGLYKW